MAAPLPDMEPRGRYRIARMDGVMWILTAIVFAVPVFFLWTEDHRLMLVAFALLLMCALVWGYGRPSHFEITSSALLISWPLRSERIARADIVATSAVTRKEFRARYGLAVRVGVGGLFGQFGWAWTQKGRVRTYISTLGPFVLIERHEGLPLLITPEEPEAFVRELS